MREELDSMHAWTPSTQKAKAESHECKASLSYIGRPYPPPTQPPPREKKNKKKGDRDMAQWLRAPTALVEDLGLIPSTHMVASQPPTTPVPVD